MAHAAISASGFQDSEAVMSAEVRQMLETGDDAPMACQAAGVIPVVGGEFVVAAVAAFEGWMLFACSTPARGHGAGSM